MNTSAVDYKRFGGEAYDEYFRRIDKGNKNLLEEIICQIARREELNPHEIALVCQFANTKILLKLLNTVDDKTVEFDVADPSSVVKSLGSPFSPGADTVEPNSVAFDDQWYSIDDDDDDEEAGIPERVLDYREIERGRNMLEDKVDEIAIRLFEDRPHLIRALASRIHSEGPRAVIIAVKSVGAPDSLLKQAFERAGVAYDDSEFDMDHYLVDDGDPLLQKVAAYGRMFASMSRYESARDKLAFIAKAIKKNPLGALTAAGELSASAEKTKGIKSTILGDQELPNKFKVVNPPRTSRPGSRGYIKPSY